MMLLSIERIGGFAGFGLPGSHIASRGQIDASALPPPDVQAIEMLFRDYSSHRMAAPHNPVRDNFHYRISRPGATAIETIEVPENLVPESLKACVKDELT